jgi:hypothetical protein
MGCALERVGCALERVGCALERVGCALERVGCALERSLLPTTFWSSLVPATTRIPVSITAPSIVSKCSYSQCVCVRVCVCV